MVNHVPARESRSRNRCQAELEGMISNIKIFMLKIFFFFNQTQEGHVMDGHFTLPRTSRRVFLQHANVKMMRDVDTQKPRWL